LKIHVKALEMNVKVIITVRLIDNLEQHYLQTFSHLNRLAIGINTVLTQCKQKGNRNKSAIGHFTWPNSADSLHVEITTQISGI